MKKPKTIMRLCPYCRKHTQHKVSQTKRKQASSLSYGSKVRARRRGFLCKNSSSMARRRGRARGFGNLGRYSKPAVTKFKMTGKKQTKKTDFRYQCTVCKKSHVQRYGIRAKRVEMV